MMMVLTFSSWTTFLDYTPLGEDSHIAPPYTKMGEALFVISSLSPYHDDDHLKTASSMGYIGSPFRCMLMEKTYPHIEIPST